MKTSIFLELDILYIDHLAVTTADFEQALADYLSLPNSRLLKGPNINHDQHVKYAFIQIQEGLVIELLAAEPESPIQEHVQRGGGPYHFCYAVTDIYQSIQHALQVGSRLIVEPTPDIAFDGRKVAFLFHAAHGIFEFVEAFPSGFQMEQKNPSQKPHPYKNQPIFSSSIPSVPSINSLRQSKGTTIQPLIEQLKQVFSKIFPNVDLTVFKTAQMSSMPDWTSLKHIQLMMELETEFEIEIPAIRLGELTSFAAILDELSNLS